MKVQALLLSLVAALSLGCHAQVKPVTNAVQLSWTAPSSCTSGCTYVVSRITLTAGTSSCPAPNTTTPNYTPLNQAAPATGTTYTDANAGGVTACYIAQTQLGNSVSQPSNAAGPFVVPVNATAPGTVTGTQTSAEAEPLIPLPVPTLAASMQASQLAGRVAGE